MTGHTMSVKLDKDTVVLTPVCHEPEGAKCRLCCDWADNSETPVHIEHVGSSIDLGYCNAIEWLTNDGADMAELYAGNDEIPLYDNMPITVHWTGDGYEWKKAE